jgi:hypothetical protein
MKKTFLQKQEIRDLLNKVIMDEVSFTRMVEIMNERVSERVGEMNEPQYIPVRKFKAGDRVRIKEGISSKTHDYIGPAFVEKMDDLIGKTMTVDRYTDRDYYVACEGTEYAFLEEWLEPYVEELKKGDLAIFWDDDKGSAFIGEYVYFIRDAPFPHRDNSDSVWANAIKFESIEQYERLIKGEI